MSTRMKIVLVVAICLVHFFAVGSAAKAELVRQSNVSDSGGEQVEQHLVYDVTNKTWWYPDLMALSKMTRKEQNQAIDKLNAEKYGNISEWHLASWEQMTEMKYSLADMAKVKNRLPWDFSNLGLSNPLVPDRTLDDRTLSSPKLAWEVEPQHFFTPTQNPGFKLFGKIPALTFNGRTDTGYGWRRNNDGSVTWSKGEADDHWMVLELAHPGQFDTMLFNDDLHYLADDAKEHGFVVPGLTDLGQVGAWVASQTRPEELRVKVIADEGLVEKEIPIVIPGREWFDVIQINLNSVKLASCSMKSHKIKDVNNDGINDLALAISNTGSCLKQEPVMLTGFLKEKYGSVAIRSFDVR